MAKNAAAPKKIGRPTKYSNDLADRICECIKTSEDGLHAICKKNGFPHLSNVMRYLDEHQYFREKYARARELQADYLADLIVQVSKKNLQTTTETTGTNASGYFEQKTKSDNYQRSRLMVDALKWKASKLAPKKYGEKLDVTTDGEKITSFNVGFKKPEDAG